MTWLWRARRDERGAALVEAALVLPLLFLLVFGIVEFSRGYNTSLTLTHSAREGVRVLAITGDSDAAEATVIAAAPGLDPAFLTVTTTDCDPGNPTQVEVQYPYTYTIPIFGTNTLTLTGTGVMRCGG